MIFGQIALTVAALFSGAAVYINVAEHSARLRLAEMMPTNKALMAMDPARPGASTRVLLQEWGGLHAVRTVLGFAATAIFLWASLG